MDERLVERLTSQEDVGVFIDRMNDTLRTTCTETFKYQTTKNYKKGKSVPWWSTTLTLMRKRTNALRMRYQRTMNNVELRTSRKSQYIEEKKYRAAIREEETNSWKQHCTITTPNNLWNEVYKLATGKIRETLTLTTLRKPDGSRTTNIDDILQTMIDMLIPEDSTQNDTIQYKNKRRLADQRIDTANDREFTQDEVRQTNESFKPGKRQVRTESQEKY